MNKNLQGGYYIVSLNDVDLLGESVSLPDIAKLLYEAKKHKFVVLQDIVMDGEKKVAIPALFDASMAYTTEPDDWDEETDGEFVPEPIYTAAIYNVYGKNIAIDAEGVATVTDYEVEADIDTLYGKFVRIIEAPESSTLTEEQMELFKNGIFVNGEYLGLKNPVFLPATVTSGYASGSIFGLCLSGGKIAIYCIDENKAISISSDYLYFNVYWNNQADITLRSNRDLQLWANRYLYLQDFRFVNPSNDNKHYFMRSIGRICSWLEGNGLYLHTITFNVSGGTDTFVVRIVSDSSTACALDSVSGNFVIAGATCLIPSNMGNEVLTPFDANGFNPDIHLFDSATGAYSTAVTLASVESDVITPIG